jgi:hypothetical protein
MSARIKVAAALHHRLESYHVAVAPYFWPKSSEQTAVSHPTVMMCDINDYDFRVPLITNALYREKIGVECPICTEVYFPIGIPSDIDWEELWRSYKGPWIWQVFDFPHAQHLACDHPMDTCRHCYARQIAAQLELNGSKKCHEISCVQCNRFLTPEEIKHFASKESYQL